MASNIEGNGFLNPVRERSSDRAPDFTGSLLLQGQQVRLVAWKRPDGSLRLALDLPPKSGSGQPQTKPIPKAEVLPYEDDMA
jgi:hypothetical protein